ncbi:MAG: hypothetical protein ILO34_09090 [Kiritimatiellae bacterium]|nr:hypothetical protein [Kiritimatiellia bacterium]
MNFSLGSALDFRLAAAALLLVFAGCGPDDGSKEYAAGMDAYALGDTARAAKMFALAAECNATNVDALVMLARADVDLGDIKGAREAITRAGEMADGSDIVLLSAEIDYHLGEFDSAWEKYHVVANDTSLDAQIRALGLVGCGIVETARGADRRDFARIAYLSAIRLDRRAASARYHLGLLYRDAYGYYEAALEQFEAYVRLEAEADARVQKVQRVFIEALKEDIARRKAEISGASRRDSSAASDAMAKAEAAMKKKDSKTARRCYEEAVKADPLSFPAAFALAQLIEKSDGTANGKKTALNLYKTACILNAGSSKAFIAAGNLAYSMSQWANSTEYYSRAVAADPANITAIDGLIRSLRKTGGKGKIADAYQKYRESIPVRRK